MVFHATGEGVNKQDAVEFFKHHDSGAYKQIKLNCTADEFLGYVDGSCGKDYAESQFLGFIFPYKWIQKIVGDGGKEIICSELVAMVLDKFKKQIKFDKSFEFLKPEECFKIIKEYQGD